jgi:Ca-activated chloride channel homolog
MFRFENIDYLNLLAIIPFLVLIFVVAGYFRKKAFAKFGELSLIQQLTPQMSKYKHTFKFVLLLFALIFFIGALSNPQWGTKKEKINRKSIDVFIALDISQSMLAQDISPSRLERAKNFCQNLVDGLKGERMGVIIFAGNAYLQMPLTTDYAAAQLFLKSANTNQAPTQGTAISDAIDLAERSFEEDNKHHKALIIITDGENHDEETLQRAKEANENGLMIFTVGVGTEGGGYIPMYFAGQAGFKMDKSGNPVKTSLNPQMLADIAEAGNGVYYNLVDGEKVISALKERIETIDKREFESRSFSEFESYFQYFLAIGLLFLIIEFMFSYRKNRWLGDKDLFKG